MKFGVREIANVVFRAKSNVKIGNTTFKVGQPVLYIDSAKTSTLEGAATTVYAQGGRGNARLIAWEGEKTLTFTVEDALLSPIGLSVLAGAGLIKKEDQDVHVHMTTTAFADTNGKIDLTDALGSEEEICADAPLFVMGVEGDGSLTGDIFTEVTVEEGGKIITATQAANKTVMVDYYVIKPSANVSEIQIDAENFAGYYYVIHYSDVRLMVLICQLILHYQMLRFSLTLHSLWLQLETHLHSHLQWMRCQDIHILIKRKKFFA